MKQGRKEKVKSLLSVESEKIFWVYFSSLTNLSVTIICHLTNGDFLSYYFSISCNSF
ncbi:MAG TPA: hypothetical protein PKJ08_08745 [Candidatus Cloacimonadota bacterium]|nr:hypothetical protein [Candidatus Cloacimonadota bacterium]